MINIRRQKINEHFINLFGKDPAKEKYLDWVWNTLEVGYAKIGGLQGVKKSDLLDDNIFWKIKKSNGKLLAVNIYKMIGNTRKGVCGSCVQTPEGKAALIGMIQDDISQLDRQAWTEVSGVLQHWNEKYKGTPIPFEIAKRILAANGKNDVEPVVDDEGNEDPYAYKRHIGGELHQKKMFGNISDIDALCKEYEYIRKMTDDLLPKLPPAAAESLDSIDKLDQLDDENDELEDQEQDEFADVAESTKKISYNTLKRMLMESFLDSSMDSSVTKMAKYSANDFRDLASKFKKSSDGRELYVADYRYGDLTRDDDISDRLVDMLNQAASIIDLMRERKHKLPR